MFKLFKRNKQRDVDYLLACPFCGCKHIEIKTYIAVGMTVLRCSKCPATMSAYYRNEAELKAAWNKRAN